MPAKVRVDRLKQVYTAAKGLNFGFRLRGFPTAPGQNGVAGYLPQLLRVTIRFCRQSEASAGVRNFIEHELVQFGKENPSTAIYVLPVRNTTPTIRGEYSNGRKVHINVKNFDLIRMQRYMNYLRTRSGEPIVKFDSSQTAQCSSVQGQWSPTYWMDAQISKSSGENLPQNQFSVHEGKGRSATDYVLDRMQNLSLKGQGSDFGIAKNENEKN